MKGWMDGWMDGRTDGWMDGWIHVDGQRTVDQWIDEGMGAR